MRRLEHNRPVDKLVLHRTEGSTIAGAWSTMNSRGVPAHGVSNLNTGEHVQLVDTDAAARSLWHVDQDGCIQWEIVGFSRNTPAENDIWYDRLATLIERICVPLGIPIVLAESWPGNEGYGRFATQRFSFTEFYDFSGICGHQHAPAKWWKLNSRTNSHWDVGALDVERLQTYLPSSEIGDDMQYIEDPNGNTAFVTNNAETWVRQVGLKSGATNRTVIPDFRFVARDAVDAGQLTNVGNTAIST